MRTITQLVTALSRTARHRAADQLAARRRDSAAAARLDAVLSALGEAYGPLAVAAAAARLSHPATLTATHARRG